MSDLVVHNNHSAPQEKARTLEGTVDTGKLFVTSKGVALHLVGVSPMLIAKLQSSGVLPEIPTRKLFLDFGGDGGEDSSDFQLEELTADTLETDEEREQWTEYTAKRNAVLSSRNDKFLKAVFAKGVIVDMSRIEEWKADMEYFGVELPAHPLDMKVEYIQTEAISNTQDMIEIITGVLGESGIPEEDLAEVRGMFQRSVRRDTPGEVVDTEREVVVSSDTDGDEGGALLGSVASDRFLPG